jgi:hypothetical protein
MELYQLSLTLISTLIIHNFTLIGQRIDSLYVPFTEKILRELLFNPVDKAKQRALEHI